MALDVNAIRSEFARLEQTNGCVRLDRVPTREDIYARWHWNRQKFCEERGWDPVKRKVGRYSFLAGGVGQPDIKLDEPPLEWRFNFDPMPLGWFDHPGARAIIAQEDQNHVFLHHLAAKNLAGWVDRPEGSDIFRMFTTGLCDDDDTVMMRELLANIHPEEYPQLYRRDALSIWHIARAALDSQVRRGRLSWWLNLHAVKPQQEN